MKIMNTMLGLSALLLVGCQNSSPDDPQGNYKVPAIENTYEKVAVGVPPLSLTVISGGWIKVLDVTGKSIIHSAQLPASPDGFVVKLDDQLKALTYGTMKGEFKPVVILPIDPTHRYELYYQR